MKRCARCGAVKPIEEFHSNVASPDGRFAYCKPCANAARMKSWRARKGIVKQLQVCANPECGRSFVPRRLDSKGCSIRCTRRASYLGNRERNVANGRAWYDKNKKRASVRRARYYATHKEQEYALNREWTKRNGERARLHSLRSQAKYRKSRHGRKARKARGLARRAIGRGDLKAWARKLRRLGGKCQHCGSTKNIEIDHILAVSKGGTNDISNLQPLCRPCNRRKQAKILPNTQLRLI